MGADATNFIDKKILKSHIVDFIVLLGYEQRESNYFHFFKRDDYRYQFGVGLKIEKEKDFWNIYTRTPYACSYYDREFQNKTIRQIKQRFGGRFWSDAGNNRYLTNNEPKKVGAESACYMAYYGLNNLFTSIHVLFRSFNDEHKNNPPLYIPRSGIILANITTSYISSIIEDYFRDLYVALLIYSDKRESIFKNVRLSSSDMVDIADGKMIIEQAVALSFSFQNIHKINKYFETLNIKIQIRSALSKPRPSLTETYFEVLDRVLEHRHGFIHRLAIEGDYTEEDVLKDTEAVRDALAEVYHHFCEVHGWRDAIKEAKEYINQYEAKKQITNGE